MADANPGHRPTASCRRRRAAHGPATSQHDCPSVQRGADCPTRPTRSLHGDDKVAAPQLAIPHRTISGSAERRPTGRNDASTTPRAEGRRGVGQHASRTAPRTLGCRAPSRWAWARSMARLTARLLAVDARGAPIAGGAHDGDDLLHGWWVGGVTHARVARRPSRTESRHPRRRTTTTSSIEQQLSHDPPRARMRGQHRGAARPRTTPLLPVIRATVLRPRNGRRCDAWKAQADLTDTSLALPGGSMSGSRPRARRRRTASALALRAAGRRRHRHWALMLEPAALQLVRTSPWIVVERWGRFPHKVDGRR
jgi:hypothetical protein